MSRRKFLYVWYIDYCINWTEVSLSADVKPSQSHRIVSNANLRFKLACLVHKILNTGHPPYLTELLQYYKPSRSTRSSASHLLSVPRHNLSFGARTFRVAAPKIWNSIPLHIRQSQTYSSFRRHLKTHYFISAHLAP